jgi:hypothetical protein
VASEGGGDQQSAENALEEMGKLNTARIRKAVDPKIMDVSGGVCLFGCCVVWGVWVCELGEWMGVGRTATCSDTGHVVCHVVQMLLLTPAFI